MNRHLAAALLRLVCTLGVALVAFALLHESWRRIEASVIAHALTDVGVSGAGQVYGTHILVEPQHSAPFLANVTSSCSALGSILAFAAIATFLLHASIARRVLAVLSASALVVVCNCVRIALALGVGVHWGSHAMVAFHDWIGTIIGLFSVLAGFTLFVFTLLPSNKRLLEAALAR